MILVFIVTAVFLIIIYKSCRKVFALKMQSDDARYLKK